MTVTAIFVDGSFFLWRHAAIYGRHHPPERIAKNLFTMCLNHMDEKQDLYRIFFYDCPPLSKKAHHPITGKAIDFSMTDSYAFRTEFHRRLVRLRKVALRLGRLNDRAGGWSLTSQATKDLLAHRITVDKLTEHDVVYRVRRKGVGMRLGLDVASICHKKLIQRLVLITGDADFVPAAKLARREGVDVILDPMWTSISEDLYIHIDGLKTVCPRPGTY